MPWETITAQTVPRCSCGEPLYYTAKPRDEGDERADLWSEDLGYLEALVWFCGSCDPNLLRVTY